MTESGTTDYITHNSFRHGDIEFFTGDCILVNAGHKRDPFVGRIVHIFEKPRSIILIRLVWLYRPKECPEGRQPYHGEKEVFQSNHLDVISKEAISDKCRVLSLTEYTSLKCQDDNDYYCRFHYAPSSGIYSLETVPVFCICQMPYNPDRTMVYCDGCHDWYHPECLSLCRGHVEAAKCRTAPHFLCPYCRAAHREPSKAPIFRSDHPEFSLSKPCFNPAFAR